MAGLWSIREFWSQNSTFKTIVDNFDRCFFFYIEFSISHLRFTGSKIRLHTSRSNWFIGKLKFWTIFRMADHILAERLHQIFRWNTQWKPQCTSLLSNSPTHSKAKQRKKNGHLMDGLEHLIRFTVCLQNFLYRTILFCFSFTHFHSNEQCRCACMSASLSCPLLVKYTWLWGQSFFFTKCPIFGVFSQNTKKTRILTTCSLHFKCPYFARTKQPLFLFWV